MVGKVQHLRLVNGDEIIGNVLRKDKKGVLVDHPLIVVQRDDDDGKMVALMRYMPYSENTCCEFVPTHIIAFADLHPEIVKYYDLSLKINKNSQKATLEYIRHANQMMEQSLYSKPLIMSDEKMAHVIIPSSNTIN